MREVPVGRYLPRLRRLARASAGSLASGDARVRATLRALLAGEASLDLRLAPDAALFKAFCTACPEPAAASDTPGESTCETDHLLQTLPPPSRNLVLLTTLEAYSVMEAAAIAGCPPAEARRRLDEAWVFLAGWGAR